MEAHDVRDAAAALLGAYRTGKPIAPLSERYPDATLVDAYRIQQEQVQAWTTSGDGIRGHKIGLVSAALQEQMGVHQPDYGHLTASMFHPADQPVPAHSFIQPRIEPELAFVLKSALQGPGVTVAEAAQAVEYAVPALEIVDSRIEDWRISIVDTIADNASTGGVILGDTPISPEALTGWSTSCTLSRNGKVMETGTADTLLGTPFDSLTWLANTLGSLGVRLEPGHVVLSGSLTRTIPIAAGDTYTADITRIGQVTAVLARDPAHTVPAPAKHRRPTEEKT
jgi:2-keto-4-pentenoate hydratase